MDGDSVDVGRFLSSHVNFVLEARKTAFRVFPYLAFIGERNADKVR